MEKRKFIKIKLQGGGTYVVPVLDFCKYMNEEIDINIPGATWDISIVAMTQEEYESLPEFQGH